MDKRISALLGAAAALTAVNSAQATPQPQAGTLAPAANYRDLLEPVPNASAALQQADEAQPTRAPRTRAPLSGETRLAYHDHHHHHHRWWRRHRHHHHHHHHHHHRRDY
jgi:hypothetical protein